MAGGGRVPPRTAILQRPRRARPAGPLAVWATT